VLHGIRRPAHSPAARDRTVSAGGWVGDHVRRMADVSGRNNHPRRAFSYVFSRVRAQRRFPLRPRQPDARTIRPRGTPTLQRTTEPYRRRRVQSRR